MLRKLALMVTSGMCMCPSVVFASGGENSGHFGITLFWLMLILCSAKIAAFIAKRFNQPEVLGEIIAGIIASWVGCDILGIELLEAFRAITPTGFSADNTKAAMLLKDFGELGIILLMLHTGIHIQWRSLRRAGARATCIAIIGVLSPLILGYFSLSICFNSMNWATKLVLATALAATSVGITAAVLQELRLIHTKTGEIILGAAIIDDILGISILSIVLGVISADHGGANSASLTDMTLSVVWILIKASCFITACIWFGLNVTPKISRFIGRLEMKGAKLVYAICYGIGVSLIANAIGLAYIIGAFMAGLALEETDFYDDKNEASAQGMIEIINHLLLPAFFFHIGMNIHVTSLLKLDVLFMSILLTFIAIVSKLLCGLVASKTTDRWSVGIGMIPRGEVGFIVLAIGLQNKLFTQNIYTAGIVMAVVTTLIIPPALKQRKKAILALDS